MIQNLKYINWVLIFVACCLGFAAGYEQARREALMHAFREVQRNSERSK